MIVRTLGIIALLALASGAQPNMDLPRFQVDPFWPKPLPNHWILGAVAGVAVDASDHVWITHRPSTLQPNETRSIWRAAPPVLELDQAGNLLSSWGGSGAGYEWPQLEHGIYVDARDNVWLGGGGDKDAQILKFTRDGTFLIENGKIARPVTNFRFNQSLADLLANVELAGRATRVAADESSSVGTPVVVPPLKVKEFTLSSVSDAI